MLILIGKKHLLTTFPAAIKTPHLAGFLLIPVFSQAANCGGLILVPMGFMVESMIEALLVLPRLP